MAKHDITIVGTLKLLPQKDRTVQVFAAGWRFEADNGDAIHIHGDPDEEVPTLVLQSADDAETIEIGGHTIADLQRLAAGA